MDDARRANSMIARTWQQTARSWHVYYLQNSHSNDIAYLLQQAYTPNNVTARPESRSTTTSLGLMSGRPG
jgi:general secretion pathway protein D